MGELRQAVGLRNLGAAATVAAKGKSAKAAAAPAFKQYREKDGRFYFKLLGADGQLLLQSLGFDSPREAAQAIGVLQKEGLAALAGLQEKVQINTGISEAELDGAFMHVYGFARDDVEYILGTFRTLASTEQKLYGEFRTRRLVLAAYDRLSAAAARSSPVFSFLTVTVAPATTAPLASATVPAIRASPCAKMIKLAKSKNVKTDKIRLMDFI